MTSVAEIEAAIEQLPPSDVKALALWLEEYQQMINASAEVFAMYDREEAFKEESCPKPNAEKSG